MSHQLPAISLSPRRSRYMLIWVRSLYLLTFLVIASAPIALSVKMLFLVTLLASKWLRTRHLGLFSADQVVWAEIKSSGRARIKLNDGRDLRARVRIDSVITPWVILLRFDVKHRWRSPVMVLFMDALPKQEMHHLRIFLRHGSFNNRNL
ncbi:MAG: hypothetical protein P8163_10100 [Candidatus Thiodiazotropha sp.]